MSIGRMLPVGFAFAQLSVYVAIAIALQYASGAHLDDFSAYNDEPSHYVTALMVRDYFAAGLPRGPMLFAENFYIHYPKMAMGHWPPAAYSLFAIWMLVFGAGRSSALLLMAVLTGACSLLLFTAAKRVLARGSSHLIAFVFLLLPLVQRHNAMIMLEIPLMLVSLAAMLAMVTLVERDRWADAVSWSLLSVAAIMTKGDGLALVLMLAIALLLLRDLRRLLRPMMLVALMIIAIACGPFTLWSKAMVRDGLGSPGWRFFFSALPQLAGFLVGFLGAGLSVCAGVGVWRKLLLPLHNRCLEPFWAVMGSSIFSVWIFHAVVPSSVEPRMIFMAAPALLLFAGAGVDRLVIRLPHRMPLPRRQIIAPALVAIAFLVTTFEVPRGYCQGFVRAVDFLLAEPKLKEVGLMVSSNTDGEGRFIAEVASHEASPQRLLIRSSKALVKTNWLLTDYQLRATTTGQVSDILNRLSIGILVVHNEPKRETHTHHQLLVTMLKENPDWQPIYSDHVRCSRHTEGEEIVIYSYKPDPFRKAANVEVDLENKIGRTLRIGAP